MPPLGTPRRHAFEQLFHKQKAKVSVETTSMGVYRSMLSSSDRLSLVSHRKVEKDPTSGFAALRYDSPHLKRNDGIATRRDWKPTRLHIEFIARLSALAK
jgi:hypothetical protein